MPRQPRLLLAKSYYHIMTRGNNKNVVFRDQSDFCYYLKRFKQFKKELQFDLFHYCLMPTHVHQLIRTNKAEDYSLFMKKINLAYFHYYRKKYGWTGHFWQGRFKSQPVGKDNYFIQCGKYIEMNPVRKKLVSKPENYQFSSFGFYFLGKKGDLLTEDPFFAEMGANDAARQKSYYKLLIGEKISESYKKKVWGNDYQRYHENRKAKYNFKNKFAV